MSPRRHLFICLIALAALAGCHTKTTRTSADTAVAITGDGHDHGGSPARHAARHAKQEVSQNDAPKDANPTDTSSASVASPSKASPPGKVSPNLPSAHSDSRKSAAAQPAKPAKLSASGIASSPAKPAQDGRISITMPPATPTPQRTVASLRLGESSRSTAAPKITPLSVDLPGLVTSAPTTAPTQRLSAVIPAPSLSDVMSSRTKPQSIDLFSRLSSPQVAAGSQDQPLSWSLPRAMAPAQIQTTSFDQTIMALPSDTMPVLWQTKGGPVYSVPILSNWLSAPAPPPPPDSSTTREDREILHVKIYQILLGHQ